LSPARQTIALLQQSNLRVFSKSQNGSFKPFPRSVFGFTGHSTIIPHEWWAIRIIGHPVAAFVPFRSDDAVDSFVLVGAL
jgi:hypothetical protein